MKNINLGILAHVDAGKTTLSEAMLYISGQIRHLGRVDHRDSFLDMDIQERERGITIFSKQARLSLSDNTSVTLLDTPGHVDFSSEMERTLQVLDYAVLIISGADGIQSHTVTLWKLLKRYQIPTFVFVNKMDLNYHSSEEIMSQLQARLSEDCIDYTDSSAMAEKIATISEEALNEYLNTGNISLETQVNLIRKRLLFPCFFGSALKLDGVREFMDLLDRLMIMPEYPEDFGAKVYKVSYDSSGERLTYMKITGGSLSSKDSIVTGEEMGQPVREKVNQIRLYSGSKYENTGNAEAGTICAITGLSGTFPGQGLGIEKDSDAPVLDSFITYQVISETDIHTVMQMLQKLEQEDPMLHVVWNDQLQELHVQLMGRVQLEVVQRLMKERFHTDIEFGPGSIVYRETIDSSMEGVGHFEPLRHYAEVHLLLEPGPRGSGLVLDSRVSEDLLDKNWQRLILTHLSERVFPGVLTGSPITDMKISIVGGRAHVKHTEGGDFRQATYRALRQGLMQTKNVLLEPYYDFELTIPDSTIGRAMTDLEQRFCHFDSPVQTGNASVISGYGPVSTLADYPLTLTAYTKGEGTLVCTPRGYDLCHNSAEVIENIGYHPEEDTANPADSVFCSHGAGFIVPWYEVPRRMHVHTPFSGLSPLAREYRDETEEEEANAPVRRSSAPQTADSLALDKELLEIFERTYGKVGKDALRETRKPIKKHPDTDDKVHVEIKEPETEYLLIDGYNVIFAWDSLKELAETSLESARNQLLEIVRAYQSFRKCISIVVFDAYNVPRPLEDIFKYQEIYVVFTKQAETADTYIERTTYDLSKKHRIRVVTSDGAEQLIVLGHGALRESAREFEQEMKEVWNEIRDTVHEFNYAEQKEQKRLDEQRLINLLEQANQHREDIDHKEHKEENAEGNHH